MNGKQPNPTAFFLDRTHGKALRKMLGAVKLNVEWHDKWFAKEELDTIWIARCAKENWVVISGDKSIEEVPEERQAVIDGKCKVFFFNDTNSFTEEWAAAVIVGRKRIAEIIDNNNGPFFVTIDKYARSHISSVRFAGEGGPKAFDDQGQPVRATASVPKPESVGTKKPQQTEMFKNN